jgi:hypothetical protein
MTCTHCYRLCTSSSSIPHTLYVSCYSHVVVIDSVSFVLLETFAMSAAAAIMPYHRFQGCTVETEFAPRGGVGEPCRALRRLGELLPPRPYPRTCCHVLACGGNTVLETELKATSGPWDGLDVHCVDGFLTNGSSTRLQIAQLVTLSTGRTQGDNTPIDVKLLLAEINTNNTGSRANADDDSQPFSSSNRGPCEQL